MDQLRSLLLRRSVKCEASSLGGLVMKEADNDPPSLRGPIFRLREVFGVIWNMTYIGKILLSVTPGEPPQTQKRDYGSQY